MKDKCAVFDKKNHIYYYTYYYLLHYSVLLANRSVLKDAVCALSLPNKCTEPYEENK